MLNRRRLLTSVAAAATGTAFGLQSARAASTIRVGTILAGTTMAAQLLKRHLEGSGYEVELFNFAGLTPLMQAMAAGNIDAGYGGINGALALSSHGVSVSLLSNACEGGWRMVGKPDIRSLSDLRGKKVAVQAGNMCHVILQWKLKQLDLADVELLFMFNNEMPTPMQRGQVDAMFGIEPYPSFVLANGWASEIWRGYDSPLGRVSLGLLGKTEFADKNRSAARALVKAHRSATAELASNVTAAAEFTAKTLNMKRDVVDESMKNLFFTDDRSAAYQQGVKALGQMMLDAKLATRLPDWGTFFRLDELA